MTESTRRTGHKPPVPQNGFAVRAFRELQGIDRPVFAERIGMSQPHLRNIETENKPARPEDLARIADALHVPVAALSRVRASELADNLQSSRREALQEVA